MPCADLGRRLQDEHEHMLEELKTLRELVTQAAKVDSLIVLVQEGFQQLGVDFKAALHPKN